ncbi:MULTISPECIES: hypothetical protein [unclassified Streptomyces]|uniref:hypothetical protein n=1 Tax=unclassified Streptomyces TaxID=2593676 RepID=UPI0035E17ECC
MSGTAPVTDGHRQSLWTLLRELDASGDAEFPRDFDRTATRERFGELVARIDAEFGRSCLDEQDVQEAAYHGRIIVPVAATASADFITVLVSNFGDLALITLGNPDSYDEEETEYLLDATDLGRITGILDGLGYRTVPEHLLWANYDGVLDLRSHATCWLDRFFFWI